MGMNLFNIKRLFRRRKYERVLGQAGQPDADVAVAAAGADARERIHSIQQHNTVGPPQTTTSMKSQEPSSRAGKGQSWGLKLRPKLVSNGILRKQKSQKSVASENVNSDRPNAVVQKFLQGPSDLAAVGESDEVYQQQCRDLLRKLSARGNRVPGIV